MTTYLSPDKPTAALITKIYSKKMIIWKSSNNLSTIRKLFIQLNKVREVIKLKLFISNGFKNSSFMHCLK